MTYLLDTTVIIDLLNGRNRRPELLVDLARQDALLACCPVNVTEIYMGLRPGEETRTEKFLRSLEFYPVTWEIASLAGSLFNKWRKKCQTLSFTDVTIASVAIANGLVLITDNRKHFPMPELQTMTLPGSPS